MIPTINKVVRVYLESATIERLKCGKPGAGRGACVGNFQRNDPIGKFCH